MTRLRGLVSTVTAIVRLGGEDPVWLTVQAGRRLPGPARTALGKALVTGRRPTTLRACGYLLLDDLHAAAAAIGPTPTGGSVDAALRVHTGQRPNVTRHPAAAMRAAWASGDLRTIEAVADNQRTPARVRERARDHLTLLQAAPRPVLPPATTLTTSTPSPSADTGVRVVHALTNSLPWTRSGYTLRSHAVLGAQSRHGIQPVALTRPGYPASIGRPWFRSEDTIDGITYLRSTPLRSPATEIARIDYWARDIVNAAIRHRATHLHTTTHFVNALATEAAARSLDVPWVYEVRGQLERTWAVGRAAAGDAEALTSERYRRWRDAEAAVAARADMVVTLSAPLAADLVARGVDAARIHLAPNGIDASLIAQSTSPSEARRQLGLSEVGIWVGAVTSVVDYEGLSVLVDAVSIARGRGHRVRCAIVGDGVGFPHLRRQVLRLGLEDAVVLPGRVPPAQARQWLLALDIVAIPRRDTPVTRTVPPIKLMEALGAARPTIISDLPAMAGVVDNGRSAAVVPPDDADALAVCLADLAGDEGLREHLAHHGRDLARKHTWDAVGQGYLTVYTCI